MKNKILFSHLRYAVRLNKYKSKMIRRLGLICFVRSSRYNKACNLQTRNLCLKSGNNSPLRRPSVSKSIRCNFYHTNSRCLAPVVSFLLSDIGEGIKEVELTEWFVKEGDEVAQFDSICEVKSDKASVTITSRFDGIIKKLHHEMDDVVLVGQPLVDIETSHSGDEEQEEEETESEGVVVHRQDQQITFDTEKVLATPAVRNIAKKNNIDLKTVKGTGPSGRILKEDIIRFVKSPQAPQKKPAQVPPPLPKTPPTTPATPLEDTTEPIKGIRKVMLANMTEANKIPHFGYNDEYDLTKLVSLRKDLKDVAKQHGVKISYLPFILKAVSMSLSEYPILNSSISDDMEHIIYKSNHNIGIAVDSPHGLLLPCIKDAQAKSVLEVAKDVVRLQDAGLANKLHPSDLSGGTFSISNIGSIGGTYAHPVIFPPQVAIGALGKIQVLPRFDYKGDVKPFHLMCVSWSADHRIIEGATMARFSNNIKSLLEDPGRMILTLK